jgi:hypothetical protein
MADCPPVTRILAGLVCGLGILYAAEDPAAVLERTRENIRLATRRIPNYTCIETVERNYYVPLANNLRRACSVILEQRRHPTPDLELRLHSTDRLRFDVAMLAAGEIFSWPGASHFEGGVTSLVRKGPIGTGAFASFLTVIFEQDASKFVYLGPVEQGGARLLEYAFDVPAAHSHYRVQVRDSWIYTAYSGTFMVDAATHTVVRMSVRRPSCPRPPNRA